MSAAYCSSRRRTRMLGPGRSLRSFLSGDWVFGLAVKGNHVDLVEMSNHSDKRAVKRGRKCATLGRRDMTIEY